MIKKPITDDDIRGFICKIEKKAGIDWKSSLLEFVNIADECSKTFSKICAILRYREDEKKKRSKIIPTGALLKELEQNLQNMKDYPGDPFYYPGDFIDDQGKDVYFDNNLATKFLMEILNIDPYTLQVNEKTFKFPSDMPTLKCYSLALKKAFYVLSQCEKIFPYKIISYLYSVLFDIYRESEKQWENILRQEKQREQNSKNQKQSDKKEQRLEVLKLHPKYPELFEAIKKYRHSGKGKDKSALNKLLTEMTEIKNPVTIRHYRNCLLEEYLNSEKR